jgi:antirestriction protein ArdC
MARDTTERRDIYQEITDKVIAAIEQGAGTWEMPWIAAARAGNAMNATTGKAYRGINIISLGMTAAGCGYERNHWASYQQWTTAGAQVRKGERGALVVYYGSTTVRDPSAPSGDDDSERTVRFLKHSHVFNVAQVDNAKPAPAGQRPNLAERIAAAEQFATASGATIRYGFDRAFYQPGSDYIAMPDFDQFRGTDGRDATEAAYGTLFHELTHWTAAPSRCNRNLTGRFGDEAYAAEELIAEMGAAFVCGALQITPEFRRDHAAYIANWLRVLKNDKRAIFTAASKASDAVDYLSKLADAPAQQVAA